MRNHGQILTLKFVNFIGEKHMTIGCFIRKCGNLMINEDLDWTVWIIFKESWKLEIYGLDFEKVVGSISK